jgi:DNA-binding NarL/FixJ family response regulator
MAAIAKKHNAKRGSSTGRLFHEPARAFVGPIRRKATVIHVLCVEDDPSVRRYLVTRLTLEPDIQLVAAVPDVMRALNHLQRGGIDLVLLDQYLPGREGAQLAQQLCPWTHDPLADRQYPAVLFCTGAASEDFEAQARLWGALGVVAKERMASDLLPAIRAVAAGSCWYSERIDALR